MWGYLTIDIIHSITFHLHNRCYDPDWISPVKIRYQSLSTPQYIYPAQKLVHNPLKTDHLLPLILLLPHNKYKPRNAFKLPIYINQISQQISLEPVRQTSP